MTYIATDDTVAERQNASIIDASTLAAVKPISNYEVVYAYRETVSYCNASARLAPIDGGLAALRTEGCIPTTRKCDVFIDQNHFRPAAGAVGVRGRFKGGDLSSTG